MKTGTKTGTKTISNIAPNDLQVAFLANDMTEIIMAENIKEIERFSDITQKNEKEYEYDMFSCIQSIKNYKEGVVALIRLKYDYNDEMDALNCGLVNINDDIYVAYRNYVNWCKEQSKVYFPLNAEVQ